VTLNMEPAEFTEHAMLGQRVREFRELRRMTLRAAASASSLSPGFLSMLERGQCSASISALRRIAQALGVSVADLFEDARPTTPQPLRFADRPKLESEPGARKYLISQRPLRHLEVYAGEFEPGSSTGDDEYTHGDSQEILMVHTGAVTLLLDGVVHHLMAGDSIEFVSSMPHKISNEETGMATVTWITSPPTPD
jgi:transcriptional regulator with XRE-family HTH domain